MNHTTYIPSIMWRPPQPRQGFGGMLDKFIGPGATRAEIWLQFFPNIVAAGGIVLYAQIAQLEWSLPQLIIAALLVFDTVGGVLTNSTNTAKRWYHREGQGIKQHFSFIAMHAAQLFLVAWFFRNHDWAFFGVFYGYLVVAALLILTSPLYLQRPTALLLYLGAILLDTYVFVPVAGMEWFIPVFFLKLLISHLLREAPYTASQENTQEISIIQDTA